MTMTLVDHTLTKLESARKAPTIDELYAAEPRLRRVMLDAADPGKPSGHFGKKDTAEMRYYDIRPRVERLIGSGRKDRANPMLVSAAAYDVAVDQLWTAASRGVTARLRQQRRRY